MTLIKKYIGDLFLTTRLYVVMGICAVLFIISFFYEPLILVPQIGCYVIAMLVLIDYFFLFIIGKMPLAKRIMADRLSNSDENKVTLQITNQMPFELYLEIIDELPVQFQKRDWILHQHFKALQQKDIVYSLRPTERGEYHFGNIIVYIKSMLGLLMRRFYIEAETMVPVYPSFMQLRKYELLSQTTIQSEHGNKRMRKIGHSMEFEQIKEYVRGDDIRTINWKATARRSSIMVNNFTDEKASRCIALLIKGD